MRARFPSPPTAHSPKARPDETRWRRSDGGERSTPASQASRVAPLFQTERTESEFALNMSDIVRYQSPQVRLSSYFKASFCGFTSLSDNAADVIKKIPTIYRATGKLGGENGVGVSFGNGRRQCLTYRRVSEANDAHI